MKFSFTINGKSGKARLGMLNTAHGEIMTPAFMPVGTAATVKAMYPEAVAATGAQVILGNTYHLMLRPTADLIADFGGLHKFMNWHEPILTDSGGFQVMSLSGLSKVKEEGVTFQSHIDGSKHLLTPEKSIEIQHKLGADITMIFDECTEYPATHERAKQSLELSNRWAKRSKDAFIPRDGYALFGIQQGSIYEDLRKISSDNLQEIGFDGYAIGGLAVGEGQEAMFAALDYSAPLLPEDKPRYLMGVGKPEDIFGAVKRGVDMFDCVIPTRSARNARAYYRGGELNIRNAANARSEAPIDDKCLCPVCMNYSRGYLHHLFKSEEMLGPMLLTWHNLHYYQDLMRKIRLLIANDELENTEFSQLWQD